MKLSILATLVTSAAAFSVSPQKVSDIQHDFELMTCYK
jgi:hypothetical protein